MWVSVSYRQREMIKWIKKHEKVVEGWICLHSETANSVEADIESILLRLSDIPENKAFVSDEYYIMKII